MSKPTVSNKIYAVVKVGYEYELVMPYDDAMVLLSSLKFVEKYIDNYGDVTKIGPYSDFKVTVSNLSYEDYIRYKANNLLLEEAPNEESS